MHIGLLTLPKIVGWTKLPRAREESVGVVAEMLPWNGPLLMGLLKVAAILAAGNSAIKAGQVYVNGYFAPSMHETPMAGQKQSGVGEAGLTKYMQSKAVFITLDAAH